MSSKQNYKIAYVHVTSFPSTEANTFDSVWSASALSEKVDTTFFIPRNKSTIKELKDYYEIQNSKLKIQSLYLNLIPDRVILKFKSTYEDLISLYLHYHPKWAKFRGLKILYVREPRELLYWGLKREKNKWMKDWIFCYEAHDTLGLDPNLFVEASESSAEPQLKDEKQAITLRAAQNFDIMICNTKILADDMKKWSGNLLQPQVLTLASPLPRLENPPKIIFGEKIVIGYIGTIDKFRGVDILLDSIRLLPENYSLRIVGRFRQEKDVDPNWLKKYTDNSEIASRLDINIVEQIMDVADEIDRCDILIQPASNDILDARYAAPLKSYGYMVRGKPIIAGDVQCHRDLFENGKNALLYALTPKQLANCIIRLGKDPRLAEKIAIGAWEKSEYFTFTRKVNDFLSMIHNLSRSKAK